MATIPPSSNDLESERSLLIKFIEYNAEHSRWSTAITLLISITVAFLFALLGAFIGDQNTNLIYKPQPKYDEISIHIDSLYLTDISGKEKKLKLSKDDTTNVVGVAINDTIIETRLNDKDSIDKISIKYTIVKGDEPIVSIYKILFSCATILSLLFSLFFYILRRVVDSKISEIREAIQKRTIDENIKQMSDEILNQLNAKEISVRGYKHSLGDNEIPSGLRKEYEAKLEEIKTGLEAYKGLVEISLEKINKLLKDEFNKE